MRKALRFVALIALLALVLASLAGCGGGKSGGQKSGGGGTYKIGAVLSLTGTYSGLGEPEQNTLKMEVDKINAEGGVNGRKIELIIEDDATDPAKAQAAASKLLQNSKVLAILGATGSGQTMSIRADVERAQVPAVSMAGASAITSPLSKWVFQTPWPNRIVVPFVLKQMAAKGYTKIGLISDSGAYGKDGRDFVLKNAGDAGVEVVSDQIFNLGDTDMSPQLTKIKGSAAQAILMWTAGKEGVIVAKNRQDLKIALPLWGASGQARKEFAEGAGPAAEGFTFGTGKILVPSSFGEGSENFKVADAFVKRYREKYGKAPDIFAAHSYDALHIVVAAMKRLPADFTAAQLRDEIEKTKGWAGLDGTFTYSPSDHNGLTESDLTLYTIKNGTWVLAQ